MKTIVQLMLFTIITGMFINCNRSKPKKSIENLRVAFNTKTTAADKYAKYGQAALKEGFDTLGKLFETVAQAERIQALNLQNALEKLGGNAGVSESAPFEVKTTLENLQDAIKVESYEMQTMYPKFIREAENEKAAEAAKTFTWSMDAEKKRLNYYRKALTSITKGNETAIDFTWYICSACGNIFNVNDLKINCVFCLTKQEKFIGIAEKPEQ